MIKVCWQDRDGGLSPNSILSNLRGERGHPVLRGGHSSGDGGGDRVVAR